MSQSQQTVAGPEFKLSLDYLFTAVSSWLIPGAGHFLLGYRVRGLVIGAAVLSLFWVGEVLSVPQSQGAGSGGSQPIAVSRKVNPIFFACQLGNGFSTLLADNLWGKPLYDNKIGSIDRALPRHLNLAILFTSVSGLLNYLVVLHILDPRTWAQARKDAS